MIDLSTRSLRQRKAIANSLQAGGTASSVSSKCHEFASTKKILRHLKDGDVVIMNRQPTLHKASMMTHKVKILHNEQVLRLHYANCNSYNADYDGDELNLHFPQNELARSEAINISFASEQYITPKDGSPLRSLVQDHICGGVLLSKMDSFFTKDQY